MDETPEGLSHIKTKFWKCYMKFYEIHALYCYFALNCFWTLNFGHNDGAFIHFCFYITLGLQCLLQLKAIQLLSYAYQLIGFCVIWILWSKCIVFNLYFSIYFDYVFIWFISSMLLSIYIINFVLFAAAVVVAWSSFFSWFIAVVLFFLFVFIYCHLLVIFCL